MAKSSVAAREIAQQIPLLAPSKALALRASFAVRARSGARAVEASAERAELTQASSRP
jgi:hypothetical protein